MSTTKEHQATRMGVLTATIIKWNSEPREVYLARAEDKRDQVLKLRPEGMSMPEIAGKLGCSIGTVHRYVTEAKKSESPQRSPTTAPDAHKTA